MAAGMKPGDAGGVFQHAATLFRFGLDDFADLALVHQCRRTRTGGGIGEQDLHVAGAHVAAVDPIDRARLALDPARDFQCLPVVHGRRRGTIGIVDRHHHFGVIARRTVAGTGKDDRVHVGGTQRFVRSLAHRPAQRLDQIRFATAIWPDHPGQTGFDHEVSGFDEGLETMEAKAREFHEHDSRLAGRESLCRDSTIEGNVGVWASRGFAARMAATMARPGPQGNRLACFSQGFCKAYEGFCRAYGIIRIRPARVPNQLFRSDLIFLSNSSNEVSPLTISPLMKKVGVELTFSTSLANF